MILVLFDVGASRIGCMCGGGVTWGVLRGVKVRIQIYLTILVHIYTSYTNRGSMSVSWSKECQDLFQVVFYLELHTALSQKLRAALMRRPF